MIPRCPRDCVKFLLELAIALNLVLSTSSMKHCERKNIKNLGIKLCQLKCNEHNLCSDFEYHIETLPYRLSRNNSKKNEKQDSRISPSRNNSNVLTGSSASETFRLAQRCLPTQPRTAICEQDEKRNYPPKHDVDKQESFANSPLHNACRKGDLNRVRRILSQGLVDINSRDEKHGRTPLMVAAKEGYCSIFSFLIRKGANMSQVDDDGKNILHWAYKGGHVSMVKCVLPQYGVRINDTHSSHFMLAALVGQRDVVEFLLCMGADVSQVDDRGRNVLHWACRGGQVSMMKYLLSQGSVDINGRARGGLTPLIVAARYGHRDVVEFLVCMGADVSLVDDRGRNVLHWACRVGHVSMMKYLLSQGSIDINGRARGGLTPLIVAARYGHRDVVEFLVCMGADVSLVDDRGRNVLHWVCMCGNVGIAKYLLSHGSVDFNGRKRSGLTPLMIATIFGRRAIFEFLVCMGVNVSHVDDNLDNVLHYASSRGRAKMVKYILSKDTVDVNRRGRFGRTPLMKAAYAGHINVFDQLVRKGGLTRLVDDKGNTILHLASLGGRLKMVKHILSQNMADINARNKDGKTAAMSVKHYRKRHVYDLLVSRGCPVK